MDTGQIDVEFRRSNTLLSADRMALSGNIFGYFPDHHRDDMDSVLGIDHSMIVLVRVLPHFLLIRPFWDEYLDSQIIELGPMVEFSFLVLNDHIFHRPLELPKKRKSGIVESSRTVPFLGQCILYQHRRYSSHGGSSATTCTPYQTNHMQVPYHIHIEIFDKCLPYPGR